MATPQKGSTQAPGAPAASGANKARVRKTPQEARAATVKRVRENVGKAVAQLQSAEIRRTGKLSGNAELVAAYEAFDAQLGKIGGADSASVQA
jgi:hypothetical protein